MKKKSCSLTLSAALFRTEKKKMGENLHVLANSKN
jgi:hypothetical protein